MNGFRKENQDPLSTLPSVKEDHRMKKQGAIDCKDFRLGVKDSAPIYVAFLFMSMSFGGLSKVTGISLIKTLTIAMFVYSIPLQTILIKIISSGISLKTAALLSVIINGRFFLMSLSLIPYFRTNAMKIIPSLLMLSASSFTVSHVKFTTSKAIKSPFNYYLGVSSAAYLVAFFSTIIGFMIVPMNNNIILENVFSIALAIHFTALTAMRKSQKKHIVSTILGFILFPCFIKITSFNTSLIIVPLLSGCFMLFLSNKKYRSFK